ncbi:MAG: DUF4091 domain-containing protein [Anaerolineae bacterium]|nr:DUF4091 domain-containing protein [Anaerolineae bacterium]
MMIHRLLLVLFILGGGSTALSQHDPVEWWLVGSTLKVEPVAAAPDDPNALLEVHTARQEYAPFQIVFRSDESVSIQINVDYPQEYFEVSLYEEKYLPTPEISEPEFFIQSRLQAPALPDGLSPLDEVLDMTPDLPGVVWVDVFVKADTPAGDYTLTIHTDEAGSRQVLVRVYPVDLPQEAAVDVILPVGEEWSVPFFASNSPDEFHKAINALLLEHSIVPGNWLSEPRYTLDGWDFSGFIQEIQNLPPGTKFLTPIPYGQGQYVIEDATGEPYTVTDFSDPDFVLRLKEYFVSLASALQEAGRLEDALVYPTDENRWVADEPLHDGPKGFEHLAEWTKIIREAGLHVIASWVYPAPIGEGWLPGTEVTDNFHVHQDYFDAAPEHYREYVAQGYEASVYLNEYGDLIDISAAIPRAMLWHAYANEVSLIMGYGDMEWVNEGYDLVDPWKNPELVVPKSGYGGGALLWPGPFPSLRVKMLREGIEDTRLLSLYADTFGIEAARSFAACLTPGLLADQNPPATLFDEAHTALLMALANNQPIEEGTLCLPEPVHDESQVLLDMNGTSLAEWEFEGAEGQIVPTDSPDDTALQVNFNGEEGGLAGYYLGEQDWSEWKALQVTVTSSSPYFTLLDIGVSDDTGGYNILRNGAILIGPYATRTLTLPLVQPLDEIQPFDWTTVKYLSLEVALTTTWTNGFGETNTFPLGSRTLTFDDFVLVR